MAPEQHARRLQASRCIETLTSAPHRGCRAARALALALALALLIPLGPASDAQAAGFVCSDIPQSQCDALTDLYSFTGGNAWTISDWGETTTACNWHGVTCRVRFGFDPTVIRIELPNNNLVGHIGLPWGDLPALAVLNLGANSLSGALPDSIGSLSLLQELLLGSNGFSGPIPPAWGSLGALTALDLSSNALTGEVSYGLGNLIALTFLSIRDNGLYGRLPLSLVNLNDLDFFYFDETRLCPPDISEFNSWLSSITVVAESGFECPRCATVTDIPAGECAVLQSLYEGHNGFNWPGQTDWWKTSTACSWEGLQCFEGHLINIVLSNNQLNGGFPTELTTLSQLGGLYLAGNDLIGEISPSIGDVATLRHLFLSNNNLSGPIPSELGQLDQLERLHLDGNSFTGSIPAELGQMSSLEELVLDRSGLSGEIPAQLGDLSRLLLLSLRGNNFTGAVPEAFGSLGDLMELYVNSTLLSGRLPQSLTGLSFLDSLDISDTSICVPDTEQMSTWLASLNSFVGSGLTCEPCELVTDIPAEECAVLESLYDGHNGVNWPKQTDWWQTPTACTWEGVSCTENHITGINLAVNELNGGFPTELASLPQLENLDLSHNNLGGSIPAAIGDMTALASLDLAVCNLSGDIPIELSQLTELTRLRLTNNPLTGGIPTWLGDLEKLQSLQLTHTDLTGEIPTQLGNLSQLNELALNSIDLTGPVPDEIGNLSELRVLWFSYTLLSGRLPQSLTALSHLGSFEFRDTDLCVPGNAEFQAWLAGISWLQGSGIDCDPLPLISLDMTVSTNGACPGLDFISVSPGTEVTYCYEVTNTGEVTLNTHRVEDSVLGVVADGVVNALAPGEQMSTAAAGVVIDATTASTGTWTAYNAGPTDVVEAQDSVTVTVLGQADTVFADGFEN